MKLKNTINVNRVYILCRLGEGATLADIYFTTIYIKANRITHKNVNDGEIILTNSYEKVITGLINNICPNYPIFLVDITELVDNEIDIIRIKHELSKISNLPNDLDYKIIYQP